MASYRYVIDEERPIRYCKDCHFYQQEHEKFPHMAVCLHDHAKLAPDLVSGESNRLTCKDMRQGRCTHEAYLYRKRGEKAAPPPNPKAPCRRVRIYRWVSRYQRLNWLRKILSNRWNNLLFEHNLAELRLRGL